MIDDSHEPFRENAATTKRVVEKAHLKGISVEAELGRLGGVEEHVTVDGGSAFLTNPDEAVQFVHKNEKLGSAGKLPEVHKALQKA